MRGACTRPRANLLDDIDVPGHAQLPELVPEHRGVERELAKFRL